MILCASRQGFLQAKVGGAELFQGIKEKSMASLDLSISQTKAHSSAAVSLAVACMGLFVPNYVQYQISPLGPQVIELYGISTDQLAQLFSAPMIPAIFLSLFAGVLIDRIGAKRTVSIGLALTAAGCVVRVAATTYSMLFAGMMLTGVSACFLMAGASKILAGFYGPDGVGAKMGVLMSSSMLGTMLATATTAMFPSLRIAFSVGAIVAIAPTVVWIAFRGEPQAETNCSLSSPKLSECLGIVLKSPGVWATGLGLAFVMGANVVISSYTPTVLGMRGFDAESAGIVTSFFMLGNLAGCYIAPALIALIGRQKPIVVVFALLTGIGIAFAWQLPSSAALSLAFFITGMSMMGVVPTLMSAPVQLPEIGPIYAGTAGGFVTMVQVLGAVVIPSYAIVPIADGEIAVIYLLGGACMVLAAVASATIKMK